jgi:hypothetical protein
MQENNYKILRSALDLLPDHPAPDGLWDRLSDALDTEAWIEEKLPQLPQYAPPVALWERIEAQIEPPVPSVSRHQSHWFWYAVLGVVLFGIMGSIYYVLVPIKIAPVAPAEVLPATPQIPIAMHPSDLPPATIPNQIKPSKYLQVQSNQTSKPTLDNPAITITTAVLNDTVRAAITLPDAELEQWVATWCAEQEVICSKPEFRELRSEYEELQAAKTELQAALGAYSDDPQLVARLTDIEREQYQIIQRIIQFI